MNKTQTIEKKITLNNTVPFWGYNVIEENNKPTIINENRVKDFVQNVLIQAKLTGINEWTVTKGSNDIIGNKYDNDALSELFKKSFNGKNRVNDSIGRNIDNRIA